VKPASKQRFRLKLIFYDELASLEAIPLNGVPSPAGHEAVGGMVRGKEDLVSLISDIGIDSVVQTRQLVEQELWPRIERTFNMLTPSQIISAIEGHFAAYHEAEERIIFADQPLTERDRVALPALKGIDLGSTRLSPAEGFQRLTDWFGRRALV
jgi:hypothetical protein